MKENKTFEVILDEKWQGKYIMGCDPYDSTNSSESFGYTIFNIPKRVFGIKKQRGFRRVVELGWEYIMKLKV